MLAQACYADSMKEVVDWIEANAPAVIGGVILFVAFMALVVVFSRRHKDDKVHTDSDDPGIQA